MKKLASQRDWSKLSDQCNAETIKSLKQTGQQMSLGCNKTFCAFFLTRIFLQVIHQSAVKLVLKCSQLLGVTAEQKQG